jgi:hypothetical protein
MTMVRNLSTIASEINRSFNAGEWSERAIAPARPYINAMSRLDAMTDRFGQDPASHIVRYFLANAGTWRGETARRVKAELNGMLAMHEKL